MSETIERKLLLAICRRIEEAEARMYTANGNQVFVHGVLFLTVHPTDSGGVSIETQAQLIAELLNREFSQPAEAE